VGVPVKPVGQHVGKQLLIKAKKKVKDALTLAQKTMTA
jgi:hypothetical protein